MMASRQPLGISHSTNRPTEKSTDGDVRFRTALTDAAEQRRRRAEAEGAAQGARRDAAIAQQQVEQLKQDLEKAKTRIAKRDALLSNGNGKEELESKLKDLIERHQASKSKYVAELESLKSANAALKTELKDSKRDKASDASLQSVMRDLERERRAKEKLQAQMEGIRGELATSRAAEEGLRARHSALQAEVDTHRVTIRSLRDAEAEKDRLEETVEMAALAYRRALKSWQSDKRKVEDALRDAVWDAATWQSKAESSAMALQNAREDAQILRSRLKIASEEREMLQCEHTSRSPTTRQDTDCFHDDIRPLPILDLSYPVLDLAISHIDFATERISWLRENNGELAMGFAKASSALRHAEAVESSLRTSYAELQTQHAGLRDALESCEAQKVGLQGQITSANQAEGDARLELGDMCARASAAEQRAKEDREALKRANDATVRSRAAQTGLEEELQQLRSALSVAERYKELYEDLEERYRILEAREAMTYEDAEQLGRQNAELLGHGHDSQKVSYVDAVRREMAMTKAELAATRSMLNSANDRIQALTSEIEAYRSVDALSQSAPRTRVVRRQPEGTALTVSNSRSARSVSGPVARR